MATRKTKSSLVALYHVFTYTLPFAFLTWSPWALLAIAGSHFLIDRFRLARFLCAFKNISFCPKAEMERLSFDLDMSTGYPKDCPNWMAVWLLIICDNLLHVLCNALAIKYL